MGGPVKKPSTIVLAAGPLNATALILLDTLRVRDEALYLTVSDSYSTVIRTHTTEAEIVTLDAFLARRERQSYDLLFIPDCDTHELDLATRVRDVYQDGVYVIVSGTGRLLLAHRSGLLKETLASSASLDRTDKHLDEMAIWVNDEIIRHGKEICLIVTHGHLSHQ